MLDETAIGARYGAVEDVMVEGEWRKRHGRLVGVHLRKLIEDAQASRDHVFAEFPAGRSGGDWFPTAL